MIGAEKIRFIGIVWINLKKVKKMDSQKSNISSGWLIPSVQLPVNESQLQAIQARASQRLADANSFLCTPESLLSIKSARAETQKEYDVLEKWRKSLKNWAMEEYKRFEADYKAATQGYSEALTLYSDEIQETEASIKKECEDGLRSYFAELCAFHHLEWLTYEQTGIKVDLSSAKSKTPKKLREQLRDFVQGVRGSVDAIMKSDNAPEIMDEYQRSLNLSSAIFTVQERHRRIEKQRSVQEARESVQDREAAMVRRAEALDPPVEIPAYEEGLDEVISRLTFTCINATRGQLHRVREFLKTEGIQYE